MKKLGIIALGSMLAWCAAAADTSSWQNLAVLKPGQKIDVRTRKGGFNGEFLRFDVQAVTIRDKKGERVLAQSDVDRVSLGKGSRGIWIGLIAGAGGGLAVGAALGSRLANESGGDFANLKPAVIGICGAAGALIGTGIGAAVRRGTLIYGR